MASQKIKDTLSGGLAAQSDRQKLGALWNQDAMQTASNGLPMDQPLPLCPLEPHDWLDVGESESLAEIMDLAAEICETPIALVSLSSGPQKWQSWMVDSKTHSTHWFSLDGVFCRYTAQQADVFVVRDLVSDPRFADCPMVLDKTQIRFYAGVPLVSAENCVLGVLGVMDQRPRQLKQHQIKTLQILSHQIVAQLQLSQDKIQLRQLTSQLHETEFQQQQQTILFQLASQIRNSLDLNTILQTTVDQIHQLLHIDRCQFLWCLPGVDKFSFATTHEAKKSELPDLLVEFPPEHELLLSKIVPTLEVLRIEDVSTATDLNSDVQELLIRSGITAQLLLPLKTQSGQIGAIICSHYTPRIWFDSEVNLLRAITDQLAIAIEQAELFSQVNANVLAAQTQAQYLAEALQTLQKTQTQLIQHEKMSSLGQLVAGVAHEINNPVNFINGNIAHATNDVTDLLELLELYQTHYPEPNPVVRKKIEEIDLEFLIDDLPKLLASMKIGADRIRQIVLSLRNFSRLDEAEIKPVDLHEGIDNTLLILQSRLKANTLNQRIQVVKEYGNLPPVECYAGQLNQVFMNLLGNAIDALDNVSEPIITITTQIINQPLPTDGTAKGTPTDSVPSVVISIRDNGCGMPESVQQKIFNPFYTTKPVGKGTGLGLSISYQIVVEKHCGTLHCISEMGAGTEFQIQIPVKSPAIVK